MQITNPMSNLTPQPRVVSGAVPNTLSGINVSKKCKGVVTHYRNDKNRGLSEHYLCLTPGYTSAHDSF